MADTSGLAECMVCHRDHRIFSGSFNHPVMGKRLGIWTVFPGVLFWVIKRGFWYLGKTIGYMSMSQYISDVYESKDTGLIVTVIAMIFTVSMWRCRQLVQGIFFRRSTAED